MKSSRIKAKKTTELPKYKFFVMAGRYIASGWDHKEDAEDARKEMAFSCNIGDLRTFPVYSARYLETRLQMNVQSADSWHSQKTLEDHLNFLKATA